MKTDFTKKEKRICVIVSLIISSLLFWGYSLIFPIVPKIEKIQIVPYSADNKNHTDNVEDFLKFYPEKNPSENVDDYVKVYYRIKAKNNCLVAVTCLQSRITNFPENDDAFIYQSGADFSKTFCYIPFETFSSVEINRKGMTDEELCEKLRSLELEVIYAHKGTYHFKKIKNVNSAKIVWDKD